MSDPIERAQTVIRTVRDTSLPKGERLRQALRTMQESDPEKWRRSVERLQTAIEQTEQQVRQLNDAIQRGADDETLTECKGKLAIFEEIQQRALDLVDAAASLLLDKAGELVVAELDKGIDRLPESAIRLARKHRELVVPSLIKALEDALAGARGGDIPKGNAAFFALFLLTEFKVKEAFPVLQEALTLPDDLPDQLFGDAVHELPPRIFALFLGDRIEALVDDRSLDYLPRWNAAHSYMHLVREGRMNREEAVSRLHHHLRRAVDHADVKIITPLVIELAYYTPAEAIETIREAYQRRFVDGFISLEEIEEEIAKRESQLEKELARCSSLDVDTLAELSRWSSFQCKSNAGSFDERSATPPELTAMPPTPTAKPHFRQGGARLAALDEPIASRQPRVGRNDPCPCGSGKKFKKCCGSRKG